MFAKKKYPVLTKTFCQTMECLRLAIEVFTGQRTRIVELDLNTGRGRVQFDTCDTGVLFTPLAANLMEFALDNFTPIDGEDDVWITARFNKPNEARVIRMNEIDSLWRVGRSANDRWQEPFQPPIRM